MTISSDDEQIVKDRPGNTKMTQIKKEVRKPDIFDEGCKKYPCALQHPNKTQRRRMCMVIYYLPVIPGQ
jgi:hypothetical protein